MRSSNAPSACFMPPARYSTSSGRLNLAHEGIILLTLSRHTLQRERVKALDPFPGLFQYLE